MFSDEIGVIFMRGKHFRRGFGVRPNDFYIVVFYLTALSQKTLVQATSFRIRCHKRRIFSWLPVLAPTRHEFIVQWLRP